MTMFSLAVHVQRACPRQQSQLLRAPLTNAVQLDCAVPCSASVTPHGSISFSNYSKSFDYKDEDDFSNCALLQLQCQSPILSHHIVAAHRLRGPLPGGHCSSPMRAGAVHRTFSSQVTAAQTATGPNFTKSQAVRLIETLTVEERNIFLKELIKVVPTVENTSRPSRRDLLQLAYHNSLPFIGFGFLDNLIMILAGEYIDLTLGTKLGITTMAAAALGNTISDMMGIGSAWYVETLAGKLGALPPDLHPAQLELLSCRVSANAGRCLGVMFGCLLGMFPLLFLDQSENEKPDTEQPDKKND